jgi:hypothetical protein
VELRGDYVNIFFNLVACCFLYKVKDLSVTLTFKLIIIFGWWLPEDKEAFPWNVNMISVKQLLGHHM